MPAWVCSENPGETDFSLVKSLSPCLGRTTTVREEQRSQDGAAKTFWEKKTEESANGIWNFFTRKVLALDNVGVRRSKA